MPSTEYREAYLDLLMENVRQAHYPSHGILDRIELSLRNRDQAEDYVGLLLEKTQDKYPSLQLLDRADRMIRFLEYHEVADALEERSGELESRSG